MTRLFFLSCCLMLYINGSAQNVVQPVSLSSQHKQQIDALNEMSWRLILKQGEIKADLDSAEMIAKQSMDLSKRFKYSNGISRSVHLLSLTGMERGTAKPVYELMHTIDDSTKAAILLDLNSYYYNGGQLPQNYDSAASCAKRAMHIAMSLKNPGLEFQCRTALFVQFSNQNQPGLMMEEYRHIQRLAPQLRKGYILQFYVTASTALLRMGDYDLMLKFCFEGLKVSESTGHAMDSYFHQLLGRTYRRMEQYQQSTEFYEKASLRYKADGAIRSTWLCREGVIFNLISLERYREALQRALEGEKEIGFRDAGDSILYYRMVGMCYLRLHRDQEAIDLFEKIEAMSARNNRMDAGTFLELAGLYADRKQYGKATQCFQRILNTNNVQIIHRASAFLGLFRVDTATKNYPSAIKNLLQYQLFNDSTRKIEKENNIRKLLAQFDMERKDKDLLLQKQSIDLLKQETALRQKDLENAGLQFDYQMTEKERDLQLAKMEAASKDKNIRLYSQNINLLKKDALLQQATITRNTFTRNMLIAGSVLMLTILLLLYSRYRLKQRNAYQLAEKNLRLETLVKEKELLVKEVHHRVKNNLQTIISLLESQASFLSNAALAELQKSQGRVYAMSLIHHKLYQQDDITTVRMDTYFHDLLTHIKSSFDVRGNIQVQEDIEPLELAVSQAIPLGLILNEAITNAIKYAFPGSSAGLISVSLQEMSDDLVQLQVKDNGIGLHQDWDQLPRKTLGFTLMRGLCGDIHGECRISSPGGTCVEVSFPKTLQFLSN
jgi:two-component sensor histidine kinase/tetratricopeptide (TPR) repeat protein